MYVFWKLPYGQSNETLLNFSHDQILALIWIEEKNGTGDHAADQRSGTYSILTVVPADHFFSLLSGKAIADLVPGISLPDDPAMSSHPAAVPMPPRV